MPLYVPLDADYFQDEKIVEAGEAAEVLYVRCLGMAKSQLRDGHLSRVVVTKYIGLDGVEERAKALVDAKLWEETDEGWLIVAWLRHNRSAADVEADREANRLGGIKSGRVRRAKRDMAAARAEESGESEASNEVGLQSGTSRGLQSVRDRHIEPEVEVQTKTEVQTKNSVYTAREDNGKPVTGYDGRADIAWWQEHVGAIPDRQLIPAQNALIRLHEHFELQPAQIRALMQFVASDSDARKFWGGKFDSPASWIKTGSDGKVGWQAIAKSMDISRAKGKDTKPTVRMVPTPTPVDITRVRQP